MNKYISLISIALTFIFTSCGEAETNQHIDAANLGVARIEIEGMMCGEGCGGKIKKELKELECVASANIEFDADNPVDLAIVEFDKNQCDEQTFIDKIQAIGDGNYHVKAVTIN